MMAGIRFDQCTVSGEGLKLQMKVRGEITHEQQQALMQEFQRQIPPGAELIIDLSDVHFIDSAGIALLVLFKRKLNEHSGELILKSLHPYIARIFSSSGLNQYFGLS